MKRRAESDEELLSSTNRSHCSHPLAGISIRNERSSDNAASCRYERGVKTCGTNCSDPKGGHYHKELLACCDALTERFLDKEDENVIFIVQLLTFITYLLPLFSLLSLPQTSSTSLPSHQLLGLVHWLLNTYRNSSTKKKEKERCPYLTRKQNFESGYDAAIGRLTLVHSEVLEVVSWLK
jgi:hypothetical protein